MCSPASGVRWHCEQEEASLAVAPMQTRMRNGEMSGISAGSTPRVGLLRAFALRNARKLRGESLRGSL